MSSDLYVNWVPTALWPGRLGLTFAPGKQGESVMQPGVVHRRDMAADMRALAREGTNVIAPLIEPFEFELLGMVGYTEHAEAHGLSVVPYPIVDLRVPTDLAAFGQFIDTLMDTLLDGRSVVVHCRGGLGRAGLVAACLLVQAGMGAADAIALVRETRHPKAIQNDAQEEFIRDFESSTRG